MPIRCLTRAAAMLLAGLCLPGPAGAADPAVSPGHVPPSWTAFAAQVSQDLQAGLANEEDPAAIRLHRYLDAQAAKDPNAPPLSPHVSLWFSRTGTVSRVQFPSLGDAQADQDLRTIVTAHPIGAAPPPTMRQPLVLRLVLSQPAP